MKACVVPFSPALVGSKVLKTFDLVILPEALSNHDTLPSGVQFKSIPVVPLDHRQEFELISRCVNTIRADLVGVSNDVVWPVLARGLYLSAIKTDFRVFVRVAAMSGELEKNGFKSISIFYRFSVFDSLFRDSDLKVNWVPCEVAPKLISAAQRRTFRRIKRLSVLGTRRSRRYIAHAFSFMRKFRS